MRHDLKSIGERAYIARTTKKLKQEHISEALGVAQSSYSRFENGFYDMPITKIITLCELLNISVTWLIFGENNN